MQILSTDYIKAVLKWVDEENLPTWLGGKSEGSLLADIGPWSDPELCQRIGVDVEALRSGKSRLTPLLHMGTAASRRVAAAAAGSQTLLAASLSLRLGEAGSREQSVSGGFHSPT